MLQNRRVYTYIIMSFILVFIPSCAWADNLFQLKPVEYFKALKLPQEGREKHLLDWREPVFAADGKVTYYQPPQPVLELLNDPSPLHAREYLNWQKAKMDRIVKAQEAVARLSKDSQ